MARRRKPDAERAPPDTLSLHEILHTAYVLYDTFGSHIVARDDVRADPEIHAAAEAVEHAMFEFYQFMGRVSFERAS